MFQRTILYHGEELAIQNKKVSTRSRVLLVILTVIVLIAAVAALAYWRYVYPTGEIMPGVYAIRTHNNSMPMGNLFLLQLGDSGSYIAIDTGGDTSETENGMQKLGISANDVIAVFITHSHWDHIGALEPFDNAIIYTGNTENSAFPDIPHHMMEDGEIKVFSNLSVQCVYTPGHTIDHVCYLVDGNMLFAGDLFITTNDSPFEQRYDKELQIEFREIVLGFDDVKYVFTGHFGLFKNTGFYQWWFLR